MKKKVSGAAGLMVFALGTAHSQQATWRSANDWTVTLWGRPGGAGGPPPSLPPSFKAAR